MPSMTNAVLAKLVENRKSGFPKIREWSKSAAFLNHDTCIPRLCKKKWTSLKKGASLTKTKLQPSFANSAHIYNMFSQRLNAVMKKIIRRKNMAKSQEKRVITLDSGEQANAAFPVIISASRSTDIPAFYSDWFFYRLNRGYSAWINPFNKKKYFIGYDDARFIVFWSKNPRPLLNHLDYLKLKGIGCYIQYTLNDYEQEGLERGIPPLGSRFDTFRELAARLGKESIIWRFDPLLLTESVGIDTLISRIRNIGSQLHEYTEKLIFSFADIFSYGKVKTNLDRNHIPYHDWTVPQMVEFAQKLTELNQHEGWGLTIATCGEMADLPGVEHNRCIDDRLIVRLCPDSPEILKFLGADICSGNTLLGPPPGRIDIGGGRYAVIAKSNMDKNQRKECGCIKSKDIGEYNSCPHLCEYCYANTSKEAAQRNHALHRQNPRSDTITGR